MGQLLSTSPSISIKKMLSIGLVLAFGSITGTLACENTTLPDGSTCPQTGLHVFEDPDHCSRYWECYNGCLNHITCKNDYLFDPVHGWCDFPGNVCCGDRDCDGRDCNDNCGGPEPGPFDCPEPQGFFPDEENCHENHITTPRPSLCDQIACDHGDGFYPEGDCAQCFCRCVGGAHYETCCAPGLFFNPAVEQCDWPGNINGCQ